MTDEDDKARRVEAGIWSVDAQAWKKRALEAEAEVKHLRDAYEKAYAEGENSVDLVYLTALRETLRGHLVAALVELANTEDHLHQAPQRRAVVDKAANLRTRLSYVEEAMRHVDAALNEKDGGHDHD